MRSRYCIAGLVFLISCTPYFPGDTKTLPPWSAVTVTETSTYVSNTTNELVFNAAVCWLGINQYSLTLDSVEFSGPGKYTVLGSSFDVAGTVGYSSTVVLIDQSGTYDSVDEYNNRSKGLNKFFQDVQSPGNYLLGGFSSQGKLTTEPVEFFQQEFGNDPAAQMPFLFDLAQLTGGKSSLYDAINAGLSRLSALNSSNKKNIVVLAHAVDGGSTTPPDSLIANALLRSIQINIILLGSADPSVMAKLSLSTGGFFIVCPSDLELMAALNLLNHTLTESGSVTNVTIRYEPESGNLSPGEETIHTMVVYYPANNYDFTPLVMYVKIPN